MASYGSSSSGSSSESGKTYEKNYENQSGYIKPKKPVNKKLIAGLACAIAAIGIGGGVGGWLYSTRDVRAARKAERLALEQQRQEKENTIALIQTYSSQGLYDNSLSLINGLLLKDNQDTDGNSLFNTTAQLKKDSDPHAGFSGQTFTDPFGNESYDSSKHSNAISIAQRYVDTALYDDASTVLNALLVDNPEDDEAKQMLDMAMTFRERASEETLKAEAEQAASDRQNALKQANDAVDSGLYDQAIALLGALSAKDPNDAEVRSLLEKASFLKEEADKAEAARNARLAKEEAEQAEKERKANEAAANQALKDQLAARASLSNEGNAGQNPPVYSEMANVITPSSGTGTQAAKNTGSSANGTSSDSKHKYSNPNAQSQGARNEGSSLADLVSGTGSQVAKNTGTSANSTSGRSEASTPKTVKTVVSNTPSSNAASSGSSAGNASSGTGTSSANRPAASATASSTAVAANTGTSSSSRNAPATNASASSSSSSGTGNVSAGNSAANASGTASSSTGTASGSAGKASASTGTSSAANTSASQTRPAVNASTGKSSAKPITVDRSTGNVRTPSSREEALARATELTDEGRYDDALRILNDLMIRNPNDKDALLRMYRAADEKRELLRRNRKGDSSSVPSAEELSQRKKQDQLSLAQKYLDAGDYEKAQQILNELAKTNKGDSQIQNMLNKANAQAKAAEEKAAREKAEKLAQEQKAAKDKADKLAQAQKALEAGDYDKAQQILNSIPANQRSDSDVTAMRNKIASEKQAAQAKAAAEKAAKDKADKLAQAQKALDSGDYAKAQQILNELAKTNKGDSQIQNMLNKANAQAKAAEEKAAAQKAAEQQAAQKAAQEKADKLAQAQKALEAGDYDKAQQILNSIPANQRSDSDVNAMRNKIASAKQAADAKAAAEKAAKEKSDKLAQAQKALEAGDYDKAQQILNSIPSAQRSDPDVNALRNKIASEKQAAQAKAAAEKAAQEKADKLAQAQKALEAGDYDKAQQILNSIPANQRSDSDVTALRNKIASEKQAAQAKAQAEKAAQEKADKLAQAQKALDAGDYAKAQAILNTLPSSEKRDTDVQALISKAAAQEKEALAKKAAEEERIKKAAEDAAKAKKQAELAALQKDIDSEIAKGKAALAAGNVEEAIAHFNKAMSMLPSDDPAYAAKKKSEIAQALYDASEATDNPADKKKLADAAKTLANEAVAKGSDDAGSHYVLGMEALKNKNYAQAEAEFEKAIKADPKNASYYYQLGRAQAQQGKFKAAQASFKNSTELNPKFAPAFYNLGYVSERLNDNSQALVSYRKAYQIDGEYERAYIAAGRIMARQGDNQGASAAFDKAIKINPANSQTYQEYGSALAAIGNYSAAENSFKKAIAYMDKSKADPATYYNLSTVLLAQEKNSEALSYAKQSYELKASANDELKNNITYNYALAQEKTGNAELAKSLYNEVLLNDPNNVKARTNLGALYNEDGQSDSAIAVLSKAYELDSSNFEVNNNLGNAYNKKENFTQAIKYYQNALAISPKDNTVRANLAKAYAGAKQYDSAKVTYEDVIAANPKDWESYLELSKVCIALGDMESAETYLTYLQKNNPTYKMAEVAKLLASIKK